MHCVSEGYRLDRNTVHSSWGVVSSCLMGKSFTRPRFVNNNTKRMRLQQLHVHFAGWLTLLVVIHVLQVTGPKARGRKVAILGDSADSSRIFYIAQNCDVGYVAPALLLGCNIWMLLIHTVVFSSGRFWFMKQR